MEFVRKATRAIGRCAIKLERAAERCINVLLELIKLKQSYVVQEAIVVIKDIFRKFPNRYESIIGTLCESLDSLEVAESEAKAAMIWIIGEYAVRIDNADELLEMFMGRFDEESPDVRLQLLTAVVKLFLKKPKEGDNKEMVQKILKLSTERSDDADLRDRGFLYWQLLSQSPKAAKAVVLAEKAVISDDTSRIEPSLLKVLTKNISTLSSVYHKPPEAFVSIAPRHFDSSKEDEEDEEPEEGSDAEEEGSDAEASEGESGEEAEDAGDDDLLGLGLDDDSAGAEDTLADLFGAPAPAPAAASNPVTMFPLVRASENKGFEMRGAFVRKGNQFVLRLQLRGYTGGIQISMNKSLFGFKQAASTFTPDAAGRCEVPMIMDSSRVSDSMDARGVQTAMKLMQGSIKPVYFFIPWDIAVLAGADGLLPGKAFMKGWKSFAADSEVNSSFGGLKTVDTAVIKERLEAQNIFLVKNFTKNQVESCYLSMKLLGGLVVLLELKFKQGFDGCKMSIKSSNASVCSCFSGILRSQLQK